MQVLATAATKSIWSTSLMLAGTFCALLAGLLLSRWVIALFQRSTRNELGSWDYEQVRLGKIRQAAPLYRIAEPLIDDLKIFFRDGQLLAHPKFTAKVQVEIDRGGDPLPFQATEFLAYNLLQSLIAMVSLGYLSSQLLSAPTALAVSILTLVVTFWSTLRQLSRRAAERLTAIKSRLPFCIDLLALMMEAGATFPDSLNTVVQETQESAVGDEMRRILNKTIGGQTLASALEQLRDRLHDPDIDELVTSILHAENLGTPLSEIFLRLADQMRLRRTQRLEKLAGQAQTMITFPMFIVMCAAVLVIVGPLVLASMINPIL